MTTAQFQAAFRIADDENVGLLHEDISIFNGFGLRDFAHATATVTQLAALIRWQARYMWGDVKWDSTALEEIRTCLRKKVTIVGV